MSNTNYAALISPISIAGSLTNSGTPNVNGKAWAYVPGTTTPATIYADAAATVSVTQPITLDAGGRVPYSTYPNGVYTTQPIRLLIQDANGNAVSDTTFEGGAGSTGVKNTGFPSSTTDDQIFSALYQSLGGTDGNYLAYAGGTPRSIQSVIRGIQLTPEDFGAKGDGNNDDTNAIQAMINKLAANGGGTGKFSGPNYKINGLLTFPAGFTGIALVGPGRGATVITQAATTDIFASTTGTGLILANLAFTGNIGLTGLSTVLISSVNINRGNSTSAYALSLSGCSIVTMEDMTASGGSQVVAISGSSSIYFNRCRLTASGTTICIDIAGTTGSVFAYGTLFNAGAGGVTGVKWESGASGTGFVFTDCPTLGGVATPLDQTNITNDPGFVQRNCGLDFVLQDNLNADAGHSVTPSTNYGTTELRVTASSGGASITVNTPTPLATAAQKGKTFTIYLVVAAAGGATFVWPAGAGQYLITASIPTANGTKYFVTFMWDGANWNLSSSGRAV